jgi:hypothetical protein
MERAWKHLVGRMRLYLHVLVQTKTHSNGDDLTTDCANTLSRTYTNTCTHTDRSFHGFDTPLQRRREALGQTVLVLTQIQTKLTTCQHRKARPVPSCSDCRDRDSRLGCVHQKEVWQAFKHSFKETGMFSRVNFGEVVPELFKVLHLTLFMT